MSAEEDILRVMGVGALRRGQVYLKLVYSGHTPERLDEAMARLLKVGKIEYVVRDRTWQAVPQKK